MSATEDCQLNQTRQQLLTSWVARRHEGLLIRRTSEPYFGHVLRVAEMARPYLPLGYEIGLCHDLLEKTGVRAESLYHQLRQFSYGRRNADHITAAVIELTNCYTKKYYPKMGKAERKKYEALRLISTRPAAQTVKYADFYDNINWVIKYDLAGSAPYLQSKLALISKMTRGNAELRQRVLDLLSSCVNHKF